MLQIEKIPELDERVWQAWLEKNAARDKLRFARRLKIVSVLAVLSVGVLLFRIVAG